MKHYQDVKTSEIFDYVYCEKEFYYMRFKWSLVLHCIVFAVGFILAVVGSLYTLVF